MRKNKYFTCVAVISPLLAMYGTGISTITLLDVALLFGFAMALVSHSASGMKTNKFQTALLLIVALIAINYCIIWIVHPASATVGVLLRTLRYIMYLMAVIVLLSDRNFHTDYALSVYEFVALFASMYLLLQFVSLYVFNYSLKGYIPFLPLMREELRDFTSSLYASEYARPRSIFAEPSQLGLYVSGYLGISVFYERKEKYRWEKLIIAIAMVLSASSTAVLTAAILMLCYFIKQFRHMKRSTVVFAISAGICVLVVAIVFMFDRIVLLIARLPTSFTNRIDGITEYFQRVEGFTAIEILLGIGMNTEDMAVWYSGPIKILLYFGLMGALVFVVLLIYSWLKMKKKQRAVFGLFLVLSVFSEMLVSNWLIVFLPFVFRNLECCKSMPRKRIAVST